MRWLRDAYRRLGTVNELFAFLWQERLWWMIPIVLAVIVVAVLVALASNPAAAPFIYTLF